MIYEIKQTLILLQQNETKTITSPKSFGDYLREQGLPTVETFSVAYLNQRHKVCHVATVSVGTLTMTLVHPRDVYGPAFRLGTVASIIVAHNHPSGDISPSSEDLQLTKRLKEAGVILGIPLLDHIIYNHETEYSFHENQTL